MINETDVMMFNVPKGTSIIGLIWVLQNRKCAHPENWRVKKDITISLCANKQWKSYEEEEEKTNGK